VTQHSGLSTRDSALRREAGGERQEGGSENGGGRSRLDPRPVLLLAWSLAPLIVFLLLRVPVVAPYFLVIYPAPFLATGWAVVGIWNLARLPIADRQAARARLKTGGLRALQFLLVVIVGVWVYRQAAFHVLLRDHLDRNGGGAGSYVSFGAQQAAMRFVARYTPDRPVLLSEDQLDPARGIDFRYWYLLWTFDHNMARFFTRDRERAECWFVIRNTHYDVRREHEEFLANYSWRDFGFLRVYVIPRPGPWPRFGVE